MPTVEVNPGDRIKFLTSQGALASEFDYDENNGILVLQDSNGDPADQKVGALGVDSINISSGYTLQDLTGSRTLGTWFSAPSDRDIWFAVAVQANSDSTYVELTPSISMSQTSNYAGIHGANLDSTQITGFSLIRVPAGMDYKADAFGDGSDYTLDIWKELR